MTETGEEQNTYLNEIKLFLKKSGNWGLDEIDCHRSHKGQCTSEKENLEEEKFWRKKNFEKKYEKKILKKDSEKKILKKTIWKKNWKKK